MKDLSHNDLSEAVRKNIAMIAGEAEYLLAKWDSPELPDDDADMYRSLKATLRNIEIGAEAVRNGIQEQMYRNL